MKKTNIVTLMLILTVSYVFAARIYECTYCGKDIISSNEPSKNGNCTNTWGHSWGVIGDTGNKLYECSQCNKIVSTSKEPYNGAGDARCPKTNNRKHSWSFIGKKGDIHYYCNNCNIEVYAEKKPSSGYSCPGKSGNGHSWVR